MMPSVQSTQSPSVGGLIPTFRIFWRDGLPRFAPVLVMMHGGYGEDAQAKRATHWGTHADERHSLVVYSHEFTHFKCALHE